MSGMLAIQPTWPPPSVPCAMMTSAPAFAARSASGTVPAMWVTLQPASWARSKQGLRSCSGPRPGELHDRRAKLERRGEAVLAHVEQQEVQPERLVGFLADGRGPLADLLRRQIVAAERAEPAGPRHRGDQRRRGGRAHAAERDRMLDVEQVADRRADHDVLRRGRSSIATPRPS